MKTSKTLISILLVAAILLGGFLYKKHRMKSEQVEAEIASLRVSAKKSFDEMKGLYDQRIEILNEIDPMMAKQIRSQVTALKLDTQEGVDQYDYFQNLVSEKLSNWLISPAGKKSPLVTKLKELEIHLIRKRAEFHQRAFEANGKITLHHSPSGEISVFKAEKMLHEMDAKPAEK